MKTLHKRAPVQRARQRDTFGVARQIQNGSALVVGLVLLLVVTILAVAGIQGTVVQERMSGNWHDRNLAFQASEAALREGERWLDASIANRLTAEGHDRLQNPSAWEGGGAHGTLDLNSADIAFPEDPAFYVNPPSFTRVEGDMDAAKPTCDRNFPVFAHGVGGTINARVTLQGTVLPRSSGVVGCPAEAGGI